MGGVDDNGDFEPNSDDAYDDEGTSNATVPMIATSSSSTTFFLPSMSSSPPGDFLAPRRDRYGRGRRDTRDATAADDDDHDDENANDVGEDASRRIDGTRKEDVAGRQCKPDVRARMTRRRRHGGDGRIISS